MREDYEPRARPFTEDDNEAFMHRLERQARDVYSGGGKADDRDQLTLDAYSNALAGDLDEARHLLRLRDRPKWWSVDQCQRVYDAHMRAQRAAQSENPS